MNLVVYLQLQNYLLQLNKPYNPLALNGTRSQRAALALGTLVNIRGLDKLENIVGRHPRIKETPATAAP